MPTASRVTAAKLSERTDDLQGRVTGVERDLQHVMATVEKTNETMLAGFNETRRMFKDSEERSSERASNLYSRITEVNERALRRNQTSWPLVISCVSVAFLLGGLIVAFVNMTTTPIKRDVAQISVKMDEDDERERLDAATASTHTAEITHLGSHLTVLEQARVDHFDRHLELAVTAGALAERTKALEKAIVTKTEDRFRGREGTALDNRITAIEEYIRQWHEKRQ